MNETMTINGEEWVRKASIPANTAIAYPATDTAGLKYVICRGYYCGVHAGYLKEHDGNHATLINSRRLWYWKADKGISLSSVAMDGISGDVSLPCALPEIWLGDVYEVIPCTDKARESIEKAATREQN